MSGLIVGRKTIGRVRTPRTFRNMPVFAVAVSLALFSASATNAQDRPLGENRDASAVPKGAAPLRRTVQPANAEQPLLTAEQWSKVDTSVDRGLEFLARRQLRDGSFPTNTFGQPAVTSLCVMAMLARGHQPGKGPYGEKMERAIDYVLSYQDADTGAFMRRGGGQGYSTSGNYNHPIAGVMLGEVYGMTTAERHDRIREAVCKGLIYTRAQQLRPKSNPDERGGWRYLTSVTENDADLSITVWMLMFLRSARNAEFDVPQQWITEAMQYVHRSFDTNERGFVYALSGDERYCNRGMVGAGVVCLALAGEHNAPTAREAGDWILRNPFRQYNRSGHFEDRYHYSAFYCSQAMFQLGGDYWHQFFPGLLDVMARNQRADGSWDPEAIKDGRFGNAYTTALSVLSLSTPYQLLPIYQR